MMQTVPISLRNQEVLDYYRCPEGKGIEDSVLTGKLSEESGFFRFGPGVICYGQSSSRVSAHALSAGLHDSFRDVSAEGSTLRLPFDPSQVVNNLRWERYAVNTPSAAEKSFPKSVIRSAYYAIRPILPVRVRRHIQRFHLRGWSEIPFPHWPVDRTIENLMERLLIVFLKAHGVQRIPFIWFWPEGFSTCTIMTHDVEELAGRDFCTKLMDINDSAGIKSSFQIVPEERYPVPDSFLNEIRQRGFEVNVHDLKHDGLLYSERGIFLQHVERINRYGKEFRAVGFRSGALYRNLDWYDDLDFSYDLSVPNVGHLEAQQGGCCTVMPYFIGKILELPLTTTQDYSLFHILQSYSIDLWKKQIDLVMEKHGLISFIIHPDYIIETRARDTYKSLLGHIAQMRSDGRTWVALPRDVNDWWRQRSQMKLLDRNGQWRIEGPGSERARIAHATVDGDNISYEIEPPRKQVVDDGEYYGSGRIIG
jgi:hypothetical protein